MTSYAYYVRVKREKTTLFMLSSETESVERLRQKVAAVVKREPESLRFFRGDEPMDDLQRPLGQYGIKNDDIVVMAYRTESGDWEAPRYTPVSVPAPVGPGSDAGLAKEMEQ